MLALIAASLATLAGLGALAIASKVGLGYYPTTDAEKAVRNACNAYRNACRNARNARNAYYNAYRNAR